MTSMLSTTAKLQHISSIPLGISPQKAIALLHGHESFIQSDPHMINYELIPPESRPPASATPTIPEDRKLSPPVAEPKCYKVTDKIAALPAGIWSSDVVSTYEFINVERGVFMRIRSPMNVVMETAWEVRERDGADGDVVTELVEDVVIKCSRFLISFMKSTCESGWKGIHEKLISKLAEEEQK